MCFMAAVKMQMFGMVKTESNNMYIFLKKKLLVEYVQAKSSDIKAEMGKRDHEMNKCLAETHFIHSSAYLFLFFTLNSDSKNFRLVRLIVIVIGNFRFFAHFRSG